MMDGERGRKHGGGLVSHIKYLWTGTQDAGNWLPLGKVTGGGVPGMEGDPLFITYFPSVSFAPCASRTYSNN